MKSITKISSTFMFCALALGVNAQEDEKNPLVITGSADMYYKYDFSGYRTEDGYSNIPTSFANEQNSISLGMLDLAISKKVDKASFVGEISFGPRGQGQSIVPGKEGDSFHLQNLYVSYDFTDKFSMTAGFMGTFIGYEIISPTGNFNYSTSYLFSTGPFQNAGIKGTYSFSDKVSLMVGLFNDWNQYQDFNGVSHVGAQLHVSPVEGWDAYLNFLNGHSAPDAGGTGTIFDLTTSYQITDAFKLGLNGANYKISDEEGGYHGGALYAQYAFSDAFALGARGEYFKNKDITTDGIKAEGTSITAVTLSGNVKAGPLTIIPELRLDSGSDEIFFKKNLNSTKTASQFLIAAVYAF
ncbi:porin [Olivibacter sp. CPCC 100613]|uniref:porin n=1 Tax=Olivibacter sp. CPCC 100613 TaxID=3079931 RepID=UPI002FF46C3C